MDKQLVVQATTEIFGELRSDAIDSYFSLEYVDHSGHRTAGLDALRSRLAALPVGVRYEPARVLADGDVVVLHGVYFGVDPDPLVAFDIFRIADDLIVEHWNAVTALVQRTASGRSQVDGPTEPDGGADTEANRHLVSEFAEQVLVGADFSLLTDFIATDTYLQHNPEAADGLDGFGAAVAMWEGLGKRPDYRNVDCVVADGDFVFVRSEGEFGVASTFNDLWRVRQGRIVEHWDVVAPIDQ
jgi:predicted SnoaL-like aldol condensation-catalyzing enzyme